MSKDYTGKRGVGKRYLDETTGALIPISTLPKEKQKEIAANSRIAANKAREARMKNRGLDTSSVEVNPSNERLLNIIEKQASTIDRLEDRLNQMEDREFTDISEAQIAKDESVEEQVKLTPKETLMAEAMDLGIEVSDKMTMKTIQTLIDEANGSVEVVVDDEEDESDL